jgi:hypothetical protein
MPLSELKGMHAIGSEEWNGDSIIELLCSKKTV